MSAPAPVCRGCAGARLNLVLDLGVMPLADALVAGDGAGDVANEARHPLRMAYCADCHLVQLLESPPPEALFGRDFPYYSSYSTQWSAHAADFAGATTGELGLGADSLVVEIGSNDGYLLRHFAAAGARVLGIDPAEGPARAARAVGVPTEIAYFDAALAGQLVADHGRADLVVANNVLAHVPDPNQLLAGAARLLKPGGLLSVEAPYLRDLIEQVEFDTIYHEHHCYFSVSALAGLFARHGFGIRSLTRLPWHGGSLRVVAAAAAEPAPALAEWLAAERAAGLDRADYYAGFGARVQALIADIRARVRALHAGGARIAAYGAAAKGAILLNATGIDAGLCEFVVDRNPHKHGKRMPGVGIPILPPEALLERQPDVVLLLAWNWAGEILAQQRDYLAAGGRFLIPLPEPRLVGADD